MATITVTNLQGHTSGGDANKVKIASGQTLDVNGTLDVTGATVTGNLPSANLTGALPALDGSALTGLDAGIGVGQTWTDVTSSRAKSTVYQNTTGKPIMVSISFTTDFTHRGQLQVSTVSGGGSGYFTIADADGGDYYSATADTDHYANLTAIIPNNVYYQLVGTDVTNLILRSWAELR